TSKRTGSTEPSGSFSRPSMRAREATDVFTTLPLAIATRREKAAVDNGFDLAAPAAGGWLGFGSSQTRLRIWLSALGESLFVLALSRRSVFEGLDGQGIPFAN